MHGYIPISPSMLNAIVWAALTPGTLALLWLAARKVGGLRPRARTQSPQTPEDHRRDSNRVALAILALVWTGLGGLVLGTEYGPPWGIPDFSARAGAHTLTHGVVFAGVTDGGTEQWVDYLRVTGGPVAGYYPFSEAPERDMFEDRLALYYCPSCDTVWLVERSPLRDTADDPSRASVVVVDLATGRQWGVDLTGRQGSIAAVRRHAAAMGGWTSASGAPSICAEARQLPLRRRWGHWML